VHLEAEFLADHLGQLACPDRFAGHNALPQEGEHLALNFVRAAGAAFFGNQARNAGLVEVRSGLVIGRPRDAILVGRLRHRSVLDGNTAQHLVFDLHSIARIEEVTFAELRVAHYLWCGVQRSLLEEDVGLRALAVALGRHLKSEGSEG
jgi:hypothetical protein